MTIAPLQDPPPRVATIRDWLSIPEEKRAELIGGRIVYHAMPGPLHGLVQGNLFSALGPRFGRRRGDAERPGGWWFSQEVDMNLDGFGCRPDLLGWLREEHPRIPAPNDQGVVTDVPTWICEVLSHSTAAYDLGPKLNEYYRVGVAWYWLADPANRTLTVLQHTPAGYVVTAAGSLGATARVKPFDAVEIDLDAVFDFGEEPVDK